MSAICSGKFHYFLRSACCVAFFTLPGAIFASQVEIKVGQTLIEVHIDQRLGKPSESAWTDWIGQAAGSLVSVSGRFPEPRLKVMLEASDRRDPITFGRVRRSRPPEVYLYVHPEAELDDLLDDWRGFHEFAHLLLPFAGNTDIWFAEGLASYYQHLLQARAGVINSSEAWRRMFAGFQRGLNDPNGRGMTLVELSPRMWRERAFRRVHWTGAAFFLRVDLRLRLSSGGEHSLDSALAAFADCCRESGRSWNAGQLIAQLGEVSVAEIWREEHERMIDDVAEPRLDWAMNKLGIKWDERDIRFVTDPEKESLRASVARGGTLRETSVQPKMGRAQSLFMAF